jgi:branched-chain amino acid transport system substrate-binding protein
MGIFDKGRVSRSRLSFRIPLIFTAVAVTLLSGFALGSPASGADAAPIVVGDICSCTGPLGAGALPTTAVLQSWAKWVNAHGGIDGHDVNLIVKDDGSNQGVAISDTKELIAAHADAIADNSITGEAWGSYARAAHIPVVGLGGTWDYPDYFVTGTTVNNYYGALAVAAKKSGAKKFGLVVCAEVAACTGAQAPTTAALKRVGIKLTYFTTISFAAPNYTAQCLATKESGAKIVEVGDAASVIQHFMEDCAKQDYQPKLVEALTVFNNWPETAAFNNTIAMMPTYPWPFHTAVTKEMYSALDKYSPGTATNPDFSGTGAAAWADGIMIQTALQLSKPGKNITAADVLNGLYKFHGETLGGLVPPTTFHKGKVSTSSCAFFLGIKNGKFVSPFGLKPTCY